MKKSNRTKSEINSAFRLPATTAAEKRMWRELEKLNEKDASVKEFRAWATKYKVKLRGKNFVQLTKTYLAPKDEVIGRQKSCRDRCKIKSFEKTVYVKKKQVIMECALDGCFYSEQKKAWICGYSCHAVMRASS